MASITEILAPQVYPILASIPEGYVTTYGDVARMAGSPRSSRHVGVILRNLPKDGSLPWHRVVNHQGGISLTGPDYFRQQKLLLAEGILFNAQGRVNLKQYRWQP